MRPMSIGYILEKVTSKVAIHTPTKEDFEFINKLLNKNLDNSYFKPKDYINCVISINENWYSLETVKKEEDYLILSIDEYTKSIGEKHLFVTKDNVNIWNPEQKIWLIHKQSKIPSYIHAQNYIGYGEKYWIFSTRQNAQKYLNQLNQKDMQKVKINIPNGYQVTQEFENKVKYEG